MINLSVMQLVKKNSSNVTRVTRVTDLTTPRRGVCVVAELRGE